MNTGDNVRCTNCDWQGVVRLGERTCPACRKQGTLAWVDPANPEEE